MFGDECVAMGGMQSLECDVYKLWLDLAGSRSKCGKLMVMLKEVGLYHLLEDEILEDAHSSPCFLRWVCQLELGCAKFR